MTDHETTPRSGRSDPTSGSATSTPSGDERPRDTASTSSRDGSATDCDATIGTSGGRATGAGAMTDGGAPASTATRERRVRAPGTGTAANRLPTRTSSWIAALAAASVIVVLLWLFPVVRRPFLIGAGGAVCLAVGIRLARRHARPPVTFVAALLAVPVALGLFGGPFLVGIALVDTIFPVPDPSLLSLGSLIILSYAGIVLGCSLAVLGLALGGFTVVTPGSLERFSSTTFVAGIPPASISILLAGGAAIGGGPGEAGILGHLAGIVAGFFLSTDPVSLNLGSFLLSLAAAILGLRLCLSTLPVRELLRDTGSPADRDRVIERTKARLSLALLATAVPGFLALAIEIFLPAGRLPGLVGPSLSDLVRLLTTAGAVRFLFLLVTVGSLGAAGVGYTLRRFARATSLSAKNRLTALVAGTVIAGLAIQSSEVLYATIVDEIAGRLPPLITPVFEEQAAAFAGALGEGTIVVLMTAALIGATGFLLLVFRGLIGTSLLSAETPGYSLAAAGLFLAVLFAVPVGLASWLAFAGVAGSLLVWDVGRFGSTLAREIGRESAQQSTDLVHATGTVLVGVVAVLAALVARAVVGTGIAPAADSHLVALGALIVGLLALVEALRLS